MILRFQKPSAAYNKTEWFIGIFGFYWDPIVNHYHLGALPYSLVYQESPRHEGHLMTVQPYLKVDTELTPFEPLFLRRTEDHSMTKEQAAYALSQVTAETVIPPLSHFASARALLECRVRLRDHIDDLLTEAIVSSLRAAGPVLHWRKLDSQVYASAIGSGVAACIDTQPGEETVYLRYSNEVAEAIKNAETGAELPRNLVGMQTNLHERFEPLLIAARKHLLQGFDY
jgi:hypothetical protein